MCFNSRYRAIISAIQTKIVDVTEMPVRADRPIKIGAVQKVGQILRPGNDEETVARKSLFNADIAKVIINAV
jgi:hypothetical protein